MQGKDPLGEALKEPPCTVPRALPGESAAPGLGCSHSIPCSPDLPHGKGFFLATSTEHTTELSQAAFLQAAFGPANPKGT